MACSLQVAVSGMLFQSGRVKGEGCREEEGEKGVIGFGDRGKQLG